MGVTVYHADLREAQADPALAALLGRSPVSAPFDRLDWLALLAEHCLPGTPCKLAIARDGDALAVLPFREGPEGAGPLGTWYSFFVRPLLNDRAKAPMLLEGLARSLAPIGAIALAPMPEAEAGALASAMRTAGWIGIAEPCDTNHILELGGRSFAEYWAGRPGQLRETVRRKTARGRVSLRIETTFNADDWAAYEAIYAKSWKPEEGNPAFLRAFAEAEGAAGALRMGIAEIEGEPVAAQFWTVEGGTAWIHKLAHDEAHRAHSPGTLLTAALFRHVIDEDHVHTVDFGTGDDPYKRDWMEAQRPRFALQFYRPAAVGHWPALARLAASAVKRRLHRPRGQPALVSPQAAS
ncbi:GNAT family N-acetyltransferase [Novosphingobium sp.]|uniref:GNAT family N-acetyltransferase n=1 Tax=Novosphingobium sp. TaxID=1874826 RepID=UPI00260E4D1C|nr:GNAT family N-acetyltransferase [Novosphingobium sp.]